MLSVCLVLLYGKSVPKHSQAALNAWGNAT